MIIKTIETFVSKIVLCLAVLAVLVGGCRQQLTMESIEPMRDIGTPVGMADYLKDLPAVQSVEKWQNEFAPGITIYTQHYEIRTTMLEPLMLRQVPAFLEAAYKEYQKQVPTPLDTNRKFLVYLFDSRGQWETFSEVFTGSQWPLYKKIQKGAYYLNGACVAYNIGRSRTFAVLGHEGWHQFNSRHFTFRLPSWLDEGIATLFETFEYRKGRFAFYPEKNLSRLGGLRKVIIDENMLSLPALISLNPGEVVHMEDNNSIMAFYSQSYALVRFLREDDYGRRLGQYHRLLFGAVKGEWPMGPQLREIAANRNIPLTVAWNRSVSPRLFATYIEEDMAQIQREYKAFCKKIAYHVRLR